MRRGRCVAGPLLLAVPSSPARGATEHDSGDAGTARARRRRRPRGPAGARPSGPPPTRTGRSSTSTFRLGDDLRTVTGTETVDLHPRPAHRRAGVPAGAQRARLHRAGQPADRQRGPRRRRGAGAATRAPAPRRPVGSTSSSCPTRWPAGESTAGGAATSPCGWARAAFERLGTDDGVSWWASGAPLLAWEPGVGWAGDPFVELTRRDRHQPGRRHHRLGGRTAALTVLMTGDQDEPTRAPGRPPHLDLARAGGPGRQRGGGHVHHRGGRGGRRPGHHRGAARLRR